MDSGYGYGYGKTKQFKNNPIIKQNSTELNNFNSWKKIY